MFLQTNLYKKITIISLFVGNMFLGATESNLNSKFMRVNKSFNMAKNSAEILFAFASDDCKKNMAIVVLLGTVALVAYHKKDVINSLFNNKNKKD